MALINCPECRKQISDQSSNCPNCGMPIAPDNREEIVLLCPKCCSQQLEMITESDGIGKTKCVVETVGPLTGTPDQDKVKAYCKKCGRISPYSKVIRARKMTNSIDEQLKQLIRDGAKLQAMKNYKDLTGCDLGTAKCYIDSLSASDGDDKTNMINNYTPKPMYKICKYCGATSTTTDKCSNCGAPIEKFDEGPVATEYTKVRQAVERHYIEAERKGMFINKQSLKRITTIIYIDNVKAFKIVSSSGNVGRYKVFAKHQDLIVAITNISKRKAVILPGRTHRFGNDMNELISTISEVLSAIDSQFDESRIKVETYEYNVLKSILPPISFIMAVVLSLISMGILVGLNDVAGLRIPGLLEIVLLVLSVPFYYILLSALFLKKSAPEYVIERKTKILSVLSFGIIALFIGLLGRWYFSYLIGMIGILGVLVTYSYILVFKVLKRTERKYYSIFIIPTLLLVIFLFQYGLGVVDDYDTIIVVIALVWLQTLIMSMVTRSYKVMIKD